MKTVFRLLGILLLAVVAAACGSDDEFMVRGTVEGDPTMNLRVVYYGRGALQTQVTAVREGKFEFSGRSTQPTLVEVFDNDYRLMGRFYTLNGQTINCHLNRSNPYLEQADGNKTMKAWSDFMRQNAEVLQAGGAKANTLVADYVRSHPDDVISTLLLITSFDASESPLLADSLMSEIAPHARPNHLVEGYNFMLQRLVTAQVLGEVQSVPFRELRTDSTGRFNPSNRAFSLMTFTERNNGRDTIAPVLKRLSARKRLQILDLSLDSDTITWRRSARRDSATWLQGWTPGYVAAPGVVELGLPHVPYYIVCDSTGTQLYRGESLSEAERTVARLLGE